MENKALRETQDMERYYELRFALLPDHLYLGVLFKLSWIEVD